jgi:hypothetical protein
MTFIIIFFRQLEFSFISRLEWFVRKGCFTRRVLVNPIWLIVKPLKEEAPHFKFE